MARVMWKEGRARIVEREVVVAHDEASRVRNAAQRAAERTSAEARAEADAIRDEARREGRDAGRAEAAGELIQAASLRLAAVRDAEHDIVALAIALAKRILDHELTIDPDRIGAMTHDLLARFRTARKARLRIAAEDEPAVRARWGERPEITIEVDATLTRGDCIVETDLGRVDGRLETRLAALEKALLEAP